MVYFLKVELQLNGLVVPRIIGNLLRQGNDTVHAEDNSLHNSTQA